MIVQKKINNNVAICIDGNQRELIAFGKGIGFPETPYELTDLRKLERTFYDVNEQYIALLNDIPYELIQFTAQMILDVQDRLSYDTNANLALTLADHIAFAIERAQKGIYVRMPSIYELEISYPVEIEIAKEFVAAIKQTFHVNLPKNEIQGIAIHLINARGDSLSEEKSSYYEEHYEEILQQTTSLIEEKFGIRVQKNTFNYARFATHIEYLLKRVYEQKYIESSNVQLYENLRKEFKDISECVDQICDYYERTWELKLSQEEKLYLILHVNRVCSNEV